MGNSTTTYPTITVTQQEELVNTYLTDVTEYNEEYETDETLDTVHIFSTVIYSVAFLLGTIGNGLVIFFTTFKMKRTVNIVWFLNLASADFIFTFCLPLSIAYTALNFHWPFGKFMCKLNSTILFINLYASVFLLTAISIDRCTSVMFPVWCQNHRTTRGASLVALVVWIVAFIFSVPHFIIRDTNLGEDFVSCYNNFHEDENVAASIHKSMVILRTIFTFIIPFSLIVLCYGIIVFRIRKNRMNTTGKPFKIILAVIVLFFICWFPYHLFSLLDLSAGHDDNDHLRGVIDAAMPFVTSLAFINSCINPVLYVFMGRDFKTKFFRSLHSALEKAFMEETVQTSFRSKTKSISESQQL
ncbi:PREDICTED: chemokine-like receptor 1 [Nanorana parkeri]|uniref:chemokine-like receptor 1 n=1 Tax=Nanorana parkeri TaxID=125878 RepID=UPI0008544E4B|nr:PREDICTED: chemokine-like receptor 1 [Nanorana parkeri]